MKHASLLFLITVLGCSSGIKPPPDEPGEPPTGGDTCPERDQAYQLGTPADDGSDKCVVEGDVTDAAGCVLSRAKVGGDGGSPGAAELSVYRTNSTQDASAELRTPGSGGPGWEWSGTNLNCSTLGCPNGHYRATIAKAGRDCPDYGNITMTLHLD